MCKVMIFSNGKKLNNNLSNVVNYIKTEITAQDDDGFGWLGVDEKGKVFGERSTFVEQFRSMWKYKNFKNKLNDVPFSVKNYNYFGDLKNSTLHGAVMFHGRTSTNDKTLINTHPIIKNDWSVIHNGVVSNLGKSYKMFTTNDTEHIVEHMSKSGINGVVDNLSGYYAVGAVDPNGDLHIIKDDVASLYMTYISKLESYVFATTEDLINNFCDEFKYKFEPITQVVDNSYIVLDKNTNNVLKFEEIKPIGMRSSFERDMVGTSLHYLNSSDKYYDSSHYYNPPKIKSQTGVVDATIKRETILNTIADDPNEQTLYLEDILEYADAGYIIYDKSDREISFDVFKQMETSEKLQCLLVDPVSMEPILPDSYGRFS